MCSTYSLQLRYEYRWIALLFSLKKGGKKDLNSTEASDQWFSMWWYHLIEGISEKHGAFWVVTMRMGTSFSRDIAKDAACFTVCKAVHWQRTVPPPAQLSNVPLVTYIDEKSVYTHFTSLPKIQIHIWNGEKEVIQNCSHHY